MAVSADHSHSNPPPGIGVRHSFATFHRSSSISRMNSGGIQHDVGDISSVSKPEASRNSQRQGDPKACQDRERHRCATERLTLSKTRSSWFTALATVLPRGSRYMVKTIRTKRSWSPKLASTPMIPMMITVAPRSHPDLPTTKHPRRRVIRFSDNDRFVCELSWRLCLKLLPRRKRAAPPEPLQPQALQEH